MEKQLILTALTDLWEPADEPVFAGKWCIRKSNMEKACELFGPVDALNIIPDKGPFMDWEKLLPDMDKLWSRWLPYLSELMNSIYGEEHDKVYWGSLLEGWFHDWYYNWLVSYRQCKKAIETILLKETENTGSNTLIYANGYDILVDRLPLSATELKEWGIPESDRYDYFFLMYFQTVLDYLRDNPGNLCKEMDPAASAGAAGLELVLKLHELPEQLAEQMKKAGVWECTQKSRHFDKLPGAADQGAAGFLRQMKHSIYGQLSKNAPVVANGLKVESGSRFMKNTLGKAYYLESVYCPVREEYDIDVRMQLADLVQFCSIGAEKLEAKSDFEEFLMGRIAFDLPIILVEDYGNQLAYLEGHLRKKAPKWAMLIHGASTSGILAAGLKEKGTRIIGRQDSVTPSLVHLPWASHIPLYDLYYCWGNTYPNGLLSPTDRYEPRPDKYLRKADQPSGDFEPKGILWCTSGAERRYPDFDGWLDAGFHQSDLDVRMQVLERFASGLSEAVAKQVSCRLRDPYGMCIHEYVEDWNNHILFDGEQVGEAVPQWSGGSLSDRIYQSQMVVVNMFLSSVLFETILRDVPVIIVAPEHTPYQKDFFRPELLPVMEELKKAGVWFTDGAKAAEFLNEMFDSKTGNGNVSGREASAAIDAWWHEKNRHDLVMRFAKMVYETSDDRTDWWSRELLRLSK